MGPSILDLPTEALCEVFTNLRSPNIGSSYLGGHGWEWSATGLSNYHDRPDYTRLEFLRP